jgi:hypothetical protein
MLPSACVVVVTAGQLLMLDSVALHKVSLGGDILGIALTSQNEANAPYEHFVCFVLPVAPCKEFTIS